MTWRFLCASKDEFDTRFPSHSTKRVLYISKLKLNGDFDDQEAASFELVSDRCKWIFERTGSERSNNAYLISNLAFENEFLYAANNMYKPGKYKRSVFLLATKMPIYSEDLKWLGTSNLKVLKNGSLDPTD